MLSDDPVQEGRECPPRKRELLRYEEYDDDPLNNGRRLVGRPLSGLYAR